MNGSNNANIVKNKYNFSVIVAVNNCNPNGDPLNGNSPRQMGDLGYMTDVCIKRKIRNRLQDMGRQVLIAQKDRGSETAEEGKMESIKTRIETYILKENDKKIEDVTSADITSHFEDVRMFGAVCAFKGKSEKQQDEDEEDQDKKKKNNVKGLSIAVRGAVSIQPAVSINRVNYEFVQITKCINGEDATKEKSSDTFGSKYIIPYALYRFNGSVNVEAANRVGLTEDDVEDLKRALITLFENDASAARPEGSMEVIKVVWWESEGMYCNATSAQIDRTFESRVKDGVKSVTGIDDFELNVNTPGEYGVKTTVYNDPEIIKFRGDMGNWCTQCEA